MGIFGKMSDKFSLKWNDFHTNAAKSFSLFRNDDYLQDVTLVADDHKQISAHKLVLSACSDYFNNIFKNSKHSHLTLCLDGVNNQDLNNILDYIYNGEVQIYQDDLDRFLAVAKRFQLNGLLENDQIEEKYEEEMHDQNSKPSFSIPPIAVQSIGKVEDNVLLQKDITTITTNAKDIKNVMEKVNEYIEKCSDGSFRCTVCGKTNNKRNAAQNMRNHIQTHLEGMSFSCNLCQMNFRSSNAMHIHKTRNH